jgi:hypothetical protein
MNSGRLCLAALGCMLIAGCATTTSPGQAPPSLAPWAGLGEPTFPEMLDSFGTANLARAPDDTLDKYLRSHSRSFDRYMAARETGADLTPLKQEAAQQIQVGAAALVGKRFIAKTTIDLEQYDAARGGFPIYTQIDHMWGLTYTNPDVRTMPYRGMTAVAENYGYLRGQVWFSREGWVLPATPDQAQHILEVLSQAGAARKISGIAVYSLDRCNQDVKELPTLQCTGTLLKLYGYSSPAMERPDVKPLVELVKFTQ